MAGKGKTESSGGELTRRFVWCLVPLGALILYIYTAYPQPAWIDSGALAAFSNMLDIPHPTGKQIYILISRLFVAGLPGDFFPLTLFSALSVAVGLWFIASIDYIHKRRKSVLPGVITALVLALAPLVWEQATVNEVFALQILIFAIFLWFWFRRESFGRTVMLFYLASLAFANHGTSIFLAPFLIDEVWRRRRQARVWLTGLGAAIFGLTLYLYFPFRSAAGAFLDWGGTSTWAGFWRHTTGWQYKVWVGGGDMAELKTALAGLWGHIWDTFPWLLVPMVAYGMWVCWQRSRRMFVTMIAAATICILFGLNYHIPDIETYFILALMLMAIWAGMGLAQVIQKNRTWGYGATVLVIVSLAPGLPAHFASENHHDFTVPTDFVYDAMETIEPGAVVLSREWDHVSPWYFLRYVRGYRPDVIWIDTELLRRTWYVDFLRKAVPDRYEHARPQMEHLRTQLELFEAGLPYDTRKIESAYADAIWALSLGQPGPVYVDGIAGGPQNWGVEATYLRDAHAAPWGLTFRLFRPGEPAPPLPSWPVYRNAGTNTTGDERTDFNLRLYDRMRTIRMSYLQSQQNLSQ